MLLYLTRSANVQTKSSCPIEKVFEPLFGLKTQGFTGRTSARHTFGERSRINLIPKRSREHVAETFGNALALTGMFRDVSSDHLDLRCDTFRQNDPPRSTRSTRRIARRGERTSSACSGRR
jgi:hypothetical protein